MGEVCSKCGLPEELCVCETIAKEKQKIKVMTSKRRYGKITTVIDGIETDDIDIKELTSNLKSKLACGGTYKDNTIELQGDHKKKVKKHLIKAGFPENQIEIR